MVKLNCTYCGKEFIRNKSELKAKSGLYFCCRKCKDLGQKLSSNIPKIHPSHYGCGKYSYRNYVDFERGCIDCGESRKYMLVVHHIDGNRENNKIDNLEVVCQNCHCKRHLDIKTLKYDTKYLTKRELIEKL